MYGIVRRYVPKVKLKMTFRHPGVREGGVRAVPFREFSGRFQRVKIDLLLNLCRKLHRFSRVEWKTKLEEHILQSHQPESNGTPLCVRTGGQSDRIVVDVDNTIEHRDSCADGGTELLEVEGGFTFAISGDVTRQVNGTEIAHRGLCRRGYFCNLGTEI